MAWQAISIDYRGVAIKVNIGLLAPYVTATNTMRSAIGGLSSHRRY
jgi:hypothetical protein